MSDRIGLVGEPEFETVREHGGDCPHGYVTVCKAEGSGIVGYVPYDEVERDTHGFYIKSSTKFIDSGGR
jgi:hypothetical protein